VATIDKITDFAVGSQVPSVTLDRMQERTLLAPAHVSVAAFTAGPDDAPVDAIDPNGTPEQVGPGGVERFFLHNTTALTGSKMMVLDDTIDWRDRIIWLQQVFVTDDADYLPGGSIDANFGVGGIDPNPDIVGPSGAFYTGDGSLTAGAVNPSDGNPPVGYAKNLLNVAALGGADENTYIYAEGASPYRLCLYARSSVPGHFYVLRFTASPPLGKR
jgi:hypothetical protein